MKIVTPAEMLAIEKEAQNQYHLLPLILMENAGKEAAFFINNNIFKDLANKRIAIFTGKGNNAGDGFVLARHLCNMGVQVRVYLLNNPTELSEDAARNFNILQSMHVRMQYLATDKDLQTLKIGILYTDLLVDAVFGTGFKGSTPPFIGKVFDIINSAGLPIVALDIPSGVEADTGKVYGKAVKATWTLAMGLYKIGLVINSGSEYAGEIVVIDISLPLALKTNRSLLRNVITTKICREIMPSRNANSHKGSYGHVIIVGGSADMSGAAMLSAGASSRSGCGLVTLALPKSLREKVSPHLPHIMTKAFSETESNSFAKLAVKELEQELVHMQSLVIGPGLSRHPETMQFVRDIIKNIKLPTVIDADALFAFKGQLDLLKNSSASIIITPHPGEMAMLTEQTVEEVQKNRIETAESIAKNLGVIVILKGYRTVIALPNGESYLAFNGNAGMAKAGSGDVLAGIIGALLAQGCNAKQAAIIGVHVHSASGDICAETLSMQGMHAGDIIENLTKAWKELE